MDFIFTLFFFIISCIYEYILIKDSKKSTISFVLSLTFGLGYIMLSGFNLISFIF